MRLFCIILMGYILGCSNMAWYLAKAANANLRGSGTGNLGASNAVVLLGWKAGVLTAVHDVLKAVLAVLAAKWLLPDLEYAEAAAGVACVLGHIFPFWLKFRGGKGFASFWGMTLALNWKLAFVILAAVVVVTVMTDYIVCGTLTTIFFRAHLYRFHPGMADCPDSSYCHSCDFCQALGKLSPDAQRYRAGIERRHPG